MQVDDPRPLPDGWRLAWGLPLLLVEPILLVASVAALASGRTFALELIGATHLGPFAILLRWDLIAYLFRDSDAALFLGPLVVLPLALVPAFRWWRTWYGIVLSFLGTLLWFAAGLFLFLIGRSA